MFKKVLVFALILVAFNCNAQDFNMGIKAGVNISKLTEPSYVKYREGVVLGLFFELYLDEKYGFQTDLLLSQQGLADKNEDIKVNIDYLNIPILFNYLVVKNFKIQAGPQFGYVTHSESKGAYLGFNGHLGSTIKFDCSAVIGIGWNFLEFMRFEARYNIGLTDVLYENEKAKNSVISLTAGYSFL